MSYRPPGGYMFPGQLPQHAQQQQAQHTQQLQGHVPPPPWHPPQQQLQPLYPLAQSLITYPNTMVVTKSEPLSPQQQQQPSSTSSSPAPPQTANPSTPTAPAPPVGPVTSVGQKEPGEELVYLAIPQSQMGRVEVKSLLGEISPVKDKDKSPAKDEPFIPPPAAAAADKVKTEPTTTEEVVTADIVGNVDKPVMLDPSVLPVGQGIIDG